MKISAITTNIYKSNPLMKENSVSNIISSTAPDSFEKKMSRPSFGDYCVDKKKFNVLDDSYSQLKSLGEVFHKASDSTIENACLERYRYKNFFSDIFAENGTETYMQAYRNFLPYVQDERNHKSSIINEINNLEALALKGDSNIGEQKLNLKRGFMALLEIENNGKKVPFQNGILLYGDATDADKNEFVDWIKNEAKASFDEVTYKEDAPFESIKNIVKKAEEAENVFNYTGKRTILYVKDIDKLLTDEEDDDSLEMIARFKSFAENAHENYHTTLLVKTNRSLDEFEEASIGSQRFESKIKLKDGITPEVKKRLKEAGAERIRLDDAAETLDSYYWYEDYYDSSDNDSSDKPMWDPFDGASEAMFRM